jgi:hypothetical protein
MAEIFSNKKSRNIGTSPSKVGSYTVPPLTVCTVIGLCIANTTLSNISISVAIRDNTNTDYYILKNADVVPGQSHVVIGGDQKVVLMTGESIVVSSDTANSVDAVMCTLELS